MTEKPENLIPYEKFLEKRDAKLSARQEAKALDIEELEIQLGELLENLQEVGREQSSEKKQELLNQIFELENRIEAGINSLDDLDEEKARMWKMYQTYKQGIKTKEHGADD